MDNLFQLENSASSMCVDIIPLGSVCACWRNVAMQVQTKHDLPEFKIKKNSNPLLESSKTTEAEHIAMSAKPSMLQ